MRSFDERIAEIHRRSEQIIRERRKRRKHILMACIPLVLCLGVFATFVLPAMMPAGSKDAAAPENAVADADQNCGFAVSWIEVSGPNLTVIHNQLPDVLRISAYLSNCTIEPPSASQSPENSTAEGKQETSDTNYGDLSDTVSTGYTVTLIMENGYATEYHLEDNLLKNVATQQIYSLSPEKANELKVLLGIFTDDPQS